MSTKPATDFVRETALRLNDKAPCYLGKAAVIGTREGFQVIVITANEANLREICRTFGPNTTLDSSAIYPVGVIHRSMITTQEDEEEL